MRIWYPKLISLSLRPGYLIMLCLGGCVEPFNFSSSLPGNFLVVEGYICTGPVSTSIHLSRSLPLSDTNRVKELHALVAVEDSLGNTYPLTETGDGTYRSALILDTTLTYRLDIRTANGEQYLSDFVRPQYSSPIDSVSWAVLDTGLQFYVSTHDPLALTAYYRWDYVATWEYHSSFDSYYTYFNGTFIPRTPDQQVRKCWISDSSNQILLGAQPGVKAVSFTMIPITSIAPHSEEVNILYSINVIQYPLSPEAYSYWSLLKKNTEQTGTIYDPQPTTSLGNIHCVNNAREIVIGYIAAGNAQEARIFINYDQLPPGWSHIHTCVAPLVIPAQSYQEDFGTGMFIPCYPDGPDAFLGSYNTCVDCTTHDHSTNVKPDFWP
jgi:hypothetical protein